MANSASSPSPIIFALMLVGASVISGIVGFSPYLFVSDDPGALHISASLTNSAVLLNQSIKVTLSESNDLRVPNELPLSNDWAVQNLTLGACAFRTQYPFGVAVFQGRYTLDNVSSAKSLLLYPDFPGEAFLCPSATPRNSNSIRLAPNQDINIAQEFSGYYTPGLTPVPGQPGGGIVGVHHSFASGVYTLVVGDEWGHTDFLYFHVSRIGYGNIVLCSPGCNYPAPFLSGKVYLNSTSPLRSLEVFINGTDEGVRAYNASLSSITLQTQYESSFPSPQIVYRGTYAVRFVVTFEDNSTFSATTDVIAG